MFNLVPGVFAIFLFVLVSVAGLVLVQRMVPVELRKQHNDVAGFIYAVLGIAYAVLLGLVVVAAWEQFQTARNTTEREASELAEVFGSATGCRKPRGIDSKSWPGPTPEWSWTRSGPS